MSKIVWVNGSFDVVHLNHLELLKFAKSLGDKLVVGIDSDNRVMNFKGAGRPINKAKERAAFLKHISNYVDEVWVFATDEQLEDTIRLVNPDIMVVGVEYKNKRIIGKELVKEVVFFEEPRITSSTEIIEKAELKKPL